MGKVAAAIIALAAIAAVAWVDDATGNEIRVYPFYFLPLAFIAWHFGRRTAIVSSFLLSLVWAASLYFGGREYSSAAIWVINILMQAVAFLVIAYLVAAMRDAYKREREASRTDPLTGLPNRRAFEEQANRLLAMCHRHGWPVTLAYLDLDNFKRVNDRRGHDAGDKVLREAADTLRSRLRHSDVAARIGGDEFVVLLSETNGISAEGTLQMLRHALSAQPSFAAWGVTATIGASTFDPAPSELGTLIRSADEVMYEAKLAGKNRVHIETERPPLLALKQTS